MDISPLIEKMRIQLVSVENDLQNPEVASNREIFTNLSRDHQRLTQLISSCDELQDVKQQLIDNQEMLGAESDPEMRELIQMDQESLKERQEELELKVLVLVLPPGEHDSRNTIVEIRPAAGGDEAALFSHDLYRMYTRYAETVGWRMELLDMTVSDLGGVRNVSFSLTGENVYRVLQFEAGVHRVQRIPTTETSGRIHTSTVTVAIMPEANDVDIELNPEDLEIKVSRASGPGGQSVNTTDSAVTITHIPTGIVAQCQNEKSQHKNKAAAMRVLRSRILEQKQAEEQAKYSAERKSQVGTGDRSELIRTYNYPQSRITDHRFAITWHNLTDVMDGSLQKMFDDIAAKYSQQRLEDELSNA